MNQEQAAVRCRPCKVGHTSGHYMSGECKECAKERSRKYARENAEKHRTRVAEWRRRNPEKVRTIRKAHYQKSRELFAQWRESNREKVRKYCRDYARRYPERAAAKEAFRRAFIMQRTPKWADRKEIERVYERARAATELTGVAYHVDHEIPLRGRKVCGLHVAANLRVIPASDNHIKSNRFEVE